jgi:hypothetical protein
MKRNVAGALDAILNDGSPDWRTRLEAQRQLLTETYGKPVQPTAELSPGHQQVTIVRPPRTRRAWRYRKGRDLRV